MPAFPVPVPQRGGRVGEGASLLKHGAAIARRVPGKQREDEHHHTSREEGLLDGGAGGGAKGCWEDCGCWNYDKKSSPGGSPRVKEHVQNFVVESC